MISLRTSLLKHLYQPIPADTNYVSAPLYRQEWHFSTPPAGRPLQLLTIGGICVVGNWCGKVGQYFTAWAPLVAQDEPSFSHLQ